MSKRERKPFVMERCPFEDERTDREVWQVTDAEFECIAPYMECCAWTDDDRYLIFESNRTGSWQPYRLKLATGETVHQLETQSVGFRAINLDPVHREVYCTSGHTYVAVNIGTLELRLAVDFGPLIGSGPPNIIQGKPQEGSTGVGTLALNHDGSLVTAMIFPPVGHEGKKLVITPTDGGNEFGIMDMSYPERAEGYVAHVTFCPGDDNVLGFCATDRQNDPEEEPFRRAGYYRVERKTGEVKPSVLVPPGFRATHCVWGRIGNRIYFHRKTVPQWVPTALCSFNRDGEDLRVYYETIEYKLDHSSPSPDEKWLVTDSQDPDENILMLVSTERDEQFMLCWPNASIGSNRPDKRLPSLPPHIRPGFSRTGRYVHYTSDVSGRSQVYVIPVEDIVI